MKLRMHHYMVLALIVLVSACNEKSYLGDGSLPVADGINVFLEDTFTVIAKNSLVDTIATSTVYSTGIGDCPSYPFTGPVSMDGILQFALPVDQFSFLGDNPKIDSIVLVLPYDNAYLDTTLPDARQTLEVYKLDQSLVFGNRYYNDDQTVTHGSTPLNHDVSTYYDFSKYEDSTVILGDTLIPQLRIRLSDAFANDLIAQNSSVFANTTSFLTWFPGVYIKAKAVTSGALGYFRTSISSMNVYYHHDTKDSLLVKFPFNTNNCAHFTKINRNFDPAYLMSVNNPNPQGEDAVYSGFASGPITDLRIPYLESLKDYVINDAVLYLTAYATSDFDPISYLFPRVLVQDDSFRISRDYRFDLANSTGYMMGDKEDITDASGNKAYRYKLRITKELTYALNEKKDLILRIGALEYSGITELTALCRNITKFGGNNRTDEYKLKLQILYSKK